MTLAIGGFMQDREPLTIWAVSDGRAGMENQVLGLAEAIARKTPAVVTTKRIKIAMPFDRLPRMLWRNPLARLHSESDILDAPYPDIWIACGRRTVPLSMAMRGRGPFVVQTQDPRAPVSAFDLVVPPTHDNLTGANVLPILGSPNRLTEERLAADAAHLAAALPALPQRKAAVLIGGTSKDYRLTDEGLKTILARLREATADGLGLLITTSRRTGDAARDAIRAALSGPRAWVWDGAPVGPLANPYFGMLGLADRTIVTEESANMITDAAFSGRPVHLLPMEGGAPKWTAFQDALTRQGVLRPNAGYKDEWSYPPIRETDRAAVDILTRYRGRHTDH